jgi:phosphoribosylformylglycinamidine cyclo-ligase
MFNGDFTAVVEKNSFNRPEIFNHLISLGVTEEHMFNTYNMGIGYVLCVEDKDVIKVIKTIHDLGDRAYKIGHVEAGGGGVCLK